MSDWDEFYLGMADYVSTQSKDPSLSVGCVITRSDNTLASIGYNGFPRGCDDSEILLRDRDTKIARTVHAELNAILNAHERLDGCTCYITHPCCAGCAGAVIQSGIVEVIVRKPTPDLLVRWGDSIDKATKMLHEAGVFYVER